MSLADSLLQDLTSIEPFFQYPRLRQRFESYKMTPNLFKTVFSLVALTSTALCGPLGKRGDDPPFGQTKGISQELFDMMQLMAQYSAAAYYPHNVNSPHDNLSCSLDQCPNLPKDNCPRVEQAATYTAEEFNGTPHGDDHGTDL